MTRLHIGSGPLILKEWVNIDNQPYPGVDQVLDVTAGLPFADVSHVFAEHFIEHLAYADGLALMRECRRVLREDGVLRLSTPNLDWVWMTHYRIDGSDEEMLQGCFAANRAFRGWGHQFLYNERTLAATLRDAGFAEVARREYGESPHRELRGLERHEKSPDWGTLSHILIVEAWGRGGTAPSGLEAPRADYLRDIALK
jgi:predicted SAM-dependent methyltransferase